MSFCITSCKILFSGVMNNTSSHRVYPLWVHYPSRCRAKLILNQRGFFLQNNGIELGIHFTHGFLDNIFLEKNVPCFLCYTKMYNGSGRKVIRHVLKQSLPKVNEIRFVKNKPKHQYQFWQVLRSKSVIIVFFFSLPAINYGKYILVHMYETSIRYRKRQILILLHATFFLDRAVARTKMWLRPSSWFNSSPWHFLVFCFPL